MRSGLTRKTITDKTGKRTTVWVKTGLHHGTQSKKRFKKFDTKRIGEFANEEGWGIYLTDVENLAKEYTSSTGNMYKVELESKGRQPRIIDARKKPDNKLWGVLSKFRDKWMSSAMDDDFKQGYKEMVKPSMKFSKIHDNLTYLLDEHNKEGQKILATHLREKGYDGTEHTAVDPYGKRVGGSTYVIFNPDIIKIRAIG